MKMPHQYRKAVGRGALLSAALALLAAGCTQNKAASGAPPPAMAVETIVAQPATVSESTEYLGQLKSRNSAILMPQVDGQVTRIFVKSGDHVAAGQAIMQIDPLKQVQTVRSQESTRAATEARLRLAQQQYQRTQALASEGVVSRQSLDEAQSAMAAARSEKAALDAQVGEQQVQLRYYRVSAPTAGVVGDIPVKVGDRVTSSTMLTTIDKSGDLEAYIAVPVERAPDLRTGLPVELLDSAGKVLASSRINFVDPEVNEATQSVLVKALITGTNLRTAQLARARIIWGSRQALQIPVLAVTRINGEFFAFVAENDSGHITAHQRLVKVGEMNGNNYTVNEGLKPGDRIITTGLQFLADGMPVAPKS